MKRGMTARTVVNLGKIIQQLQDYYTEREGVMTVERKPIVVLTDRISRAIDYLQIDKKIKFREMQVPKRRLIAENGQVYVLCYDPKQLMGWEFSEIIVVPGASNKSGFHELYDLARTRIR